MNVKKAFYYVTTISLAALYINPYNRVYAQSHEISAPYANASQDQETPQFIFPAACHYGQDCWAVNYVDVDPEEGEDAVLDFKCRKKTYDGHKGTDFALGSVEQMREGVDVLAAAPGKVLRVRDGESDALKTQAELDDIKKEQKECGNGILIDHGNGLQTMYCHLKNGSVTVKPHQKVKAGEAIAQIGQSGLAEFPHLHFGVFWEGGVVDPYTGLLNTQGCGQVKASLWHIGLPMNYEPVVIFGGGFRSTVPDFKAIERGNSPNPETLSLSIASFVFWSGFYNVEEGDLVILDVRDPDGNPFVSREQTVEKTRARQYYYTGRKIGNVQLKRGVYTGRVTLTRQAKNQQTPPVTRTKEFSVTVE